MANVKIGFLRALVVDDGRVSRTQMRDMLKKAGFKHIDDAENAETAASKMDAFPFDIVFLDWLMPGKSGISLLEQWREDRRYDDVAVVVVSAENDPRKIQGAMKAGATSYVTKPIIDKVLREHIDKAVAWLNQRRQLKEQEINRDDPVVVPMIRKDDPKKK